MRPKDPKTRKNVLCLSKDIPKALKEMLKIRDDFVVLNESIDAFIEYERSLKLMKKKKCALSVSNTKDSFVFIRSYDHQPLEILKFKIIKSLSSSDFSTIPAEFYSKYFILCQNIENKRIENFFIDFFSQSSTKVNISGVKYAWVIAADSEGKVFTLKYVRVLNDFSVEDIGPLFEMKLEKEFYCGDDLYEKAYVSDKEKKQKNVSKNVFKDKIGKLHIDKQDLNDINHKKSRAYKKMEEVKK